MFTETYGNYNKASVQSVAMPCCGISRKLHDDRGSDFRRIVCRKCGKKWYVRYLGGGEFQFKRSITK